MTRTRIFTHLFRLCLAILVLVVRPPLVLPSAASCALGNDLASLGTSADPVRVAGAVTGRASLEVQPSQGGDETTCLPAAPLFAGLQRPAPFVLLRMGRQVARPLARELAGFPSGLIGRYPPARAPPLRV